MKKIIFLFIPVFISVCIFGQNADQNVISTTGNYSENGNFSMSYTIGQTAVYTLNGNIIVTQGFQQPFFNITEISNNTHFRIKIYPIPAKDYIFIQFQEDLKQDFNISIFDINGKKIFSKTTNSKISKIPITFLTESIYFLKISIKEQEKTYKIIKVNK